MSGLTWKSLTAPEYLMAFLEGFLLMFLPGIAGGKAVVDGGAIDLTTPPSVVTVLVAAGFGLLNGIRSLRNLRAPAPEPRPTPPPEAK